MANWTALVTAIAELLKAVAWPVVVIAILLAYRSRIGSCIEVLMKKIETASKVKAWQIEIEGREQKVKEVLDATGKTATEEIQTEIPAAQIKAAGEVERALIDSALYHQIESLVNEYENIRKQMPRSPLRTRRMNEVAAKMRALGLVARPMLRSLQAGFLAGERLAAICILQVTPEFGYFYWLIDRIKTEQQPFILFQAALAVLEMVKAQMYRDKDAVKIAIEDAKQHVTNFQGGTADKNTIDVLAMALSQLG